MKKIKNFLGLKFKNKKGNAIVDTIMFLVIILAFGIAIFFGSMVLSETNEDMQDDQDISDDAKEIIGGVQERYVSLFDGLFLFVFMVMWMLVLVASFKIDTHPIFFVFTVILLIAVFIVAAILGNTYYDIATDPEIEAYALSFTMTYYIMTHLLTAAIVVAFSIVLVLFGKSRL